MVSFWKETTTADLKLHAEQEPYVFIPCYKDTKKKEFEIATVKPHNEAGSEGKQVLKPEHLLSATWISSPDQQQWNYENTPLFQRFDFQYPNTQTVVSSDCFKFSNGIGFPLKYSPNVLLGTLQTTRDPFPLYLLAPTDHRSLTDAHNHQDKTEHKEASCLEWLSRGAVLTSCKPFLTNSGEQ